MKTVNDVFDKVYCINLDRAPERWVLCEEQFNKYNIEVERFSAIEPQAGNFNLLRGEVGCLQSHLEVLKKAQEKKIKKCNLDIGRQTSTKGSKLYAVVKGAIESGLDINCDKKILFYLLRQIFSFF